MLYACQRNDGGVSILHMVEGADVAIEVEKLEQTLGSMIQEDGTAVKIEVTSYRPVTIEQLPTDRKWRNAWTDHYDTDTVDVDVEKGKELLKEQYRRIRVPAFEALDVAFNKATGNADKQLDIESKRQILRDLPQRDLGHIKTVEDLDANWLDEIPLRKD